MRITTLNSVVKSLKHFYKLPHNKQDKKQRIVILSAAKDLMRLTRSFAALKMTFALVIKYTIAKIFL